MSSCATIAIPVIGGAPQIPAGHSFLDVSQDGEREMVNTDRFFQERFRVDPRLEIYYSANELVIQFARDCAADQTLQFVYTFESGRWLFISSDRVLLRFAVAGD